MCSIDDGYRRKQRSSHRNRSRYSSDGISDTDGVDELNEACKNLLNYINFDNFIDRKDCGTSPFELDSTPTIECFYRIGSEDLKRKFIADVRAGDVLLVRIRRVELAALYVQPICVLKPFRRVLALLSNYQVIVARNLDAGLNFRTNDKVKVIVAECDGVNDLRLELIDDSGPNLANQSPIYYRNYEGLKNGSTFDDFVMKNSSSCNPNLDHLLSLSTSICASLLPELDGVDFSANRRAPVMREVQNRAFSMNLAQKGVDDVRSGNLSKAIHQFDMALNTDSHNVEALVGRAAAYANMKNFLSAERDLDEALRLDGSHKNAQTYMIEILFKLAEQFVEQSREDLAKSKLEKLLSLKEDDFRAREHLRKLRKRSKATKRKNLSPVR